MVGWDPWLQFLVLFAGGYGATRLAFWLMDRKKARP